MNTTVATAGAAEAAAPKPSPVRSMLKLAILLFVIVALAAYAYRWWTTGRYREKTDDAYVGGDLTVVAPKVAGFVVELPVTDNQFVHAGELLARLDDRDYRAGLAKASAALDAQVAALANFGSEAALQQAVIARARAEIDAANAEAVRSRDDNQRYQDLVSRSSVSVESAQRTEAAYKAAQANVMKARAELEAARRQLDVIATGKQQAAAQLEQARAELDLARLNVGYTEIRAPIDGYVGNRKARVGIYAAPGTQLLSVVPAHGLWVDANFKEDQLARMHVGQAVTIRADTLPGKEMHGQLESLAPATGAQFSILPPENATGNFTKIVQRVPVRIRLSTQDSTLGELRPGLSVEAEVDTQSEASAPGAAPVDRVSVK